MKTNAWPVVDLCGEWKMTYFRHKSGASGGFAGGDLGGPSGNAVGGPSGNALGGASGNTVGGPSGNALGGASGNALGFATSDGIAAPLPVVRASVPGNFEIDLENAGIIGDPFFGKNLLEMRRWESYHFVYGRKFVYAPVPGTKPVLVFEGLDTLADIYLNGKLLARTDNMFVTHEIAADGIVEGENDVLVHFRPVCVEARGNSVSAGNYHLEYNYEALRLRKAAHSFGWDIMPRMVTAGIFRPASLVCRPDEHARQVYVQTTGVDLHNNRASLEIFYDYHIESPDLAGYTVTVEGRLAYASAAGDGGAENSRACAPSDSQIAFSHTAPLWFTAGKLRVDVEGARFWFPKGYGGQNLYDVTVTLKNGGAVVDTYTARTGLRTVKLFRDSVTDSLMSGDFHFEVNGRRIFVLGSNWVPVDALHSRDRARLPRIMELLDDVGCNAIRVWGGNLYEDDYLYDRCDELGVLVWQDFCLACGVYPIDSEFQKVMEREAVSAVRRLRQHPSLLIWAGDNECDSGLMGGGVAFNRNPNQNHITRKVFADVCAFEDPSRPYLPSSPYIDETAWKYPGDFLPENHPWGPRDYFRGAYYNSLLCAFASEIGYHGCNSPGSIKKFISPDKLWPYGGNEEWLVHSASPQADGKGPYAYRIELMAKQIRELFGEIPGNLEEFALASQVSQAEAKKFFIEMFRGGKPKRSGLIWWNLIDGWPQFSDAVVDYYYEKKLAYHYIKMAQKPFILSIGEPKNWYCELRAINDSGAGLHFSYTVREYVYDPVCAAACAPAPAAACAPVPTDAPAAAPARGLTPFADGYRFYGNASGGKVVCAGDGHISGDAVVALAKIPFSYGEKKIFLLEWECGEHSGKNHYLCGNPPFDLSWYRNIIF